MTNDDWIRVCRGCAMLRKDLGITQAEVAKELDVTVKAISHFENGRSSNARIFLWYVAHADDRFRGGENA